MKHANIASLLKWEETPDTSEGLFLQIEEASAIEARLTELSEQLTASTAEKEAAAQTIANLQAQLSNAQAAQKTAEDNLAVANQTISERDARIAALEAEQQQPASPPDTGKDEFAKTKTAAMDFDFQKDLMARL